MRIITIKGGLWARSSRGQDTGLSRLQQGFESPTRHGIV